MERCGITWSVDQDKEYNEYYSPAYNKDRRGDLNRIWSYIEALCMSNDKFQDEIGELKQEICDKFEDKIRELKQEICDNQDEIRELKQEVSENHAEIRELRQEVSDSREKLLYLLEIDKMREKDIAQKLSNDTINADP